MMRYFLHPALALAAGLAASLPFPVSGGTMTADIAIVHDGRTGMALFGYDPVAYHVESRAVEGLASLTLKHGGLEWRFTSAANLAAFSASPATFVPALGGHDPVAAANGAMAHGDPEFFLLAGSRLYLFRSAERRQEAQDNLDIIDRAEAGWLALSRNQRGQ